MTKLSERIEAAGAEPLDYCNTCNGPVVPKTRMQLLLHSLAYDLYMPLPDWLAFSKLGYAMLPFVGSHAYSCTCPNKVLDRSGGL